MQDRYAGDVGDFVKFGLLCHVAKSTPKHLKLGINWYLVRDEEHRADGKHISYLEPSNRIGRKLATLAPNLYVNLATIVHQKRRVVAELESAGLRIRSPHFWHSF